MTEYKVWVFGIHTKRAKIFRATNVKELQKQVEAMYGKVYYKWKYK